MWIEIRKEIAGLLAIALLGICVGGCGGGIGMRPISGKSTISEAALPPNTLLAHGYVKGDQDEDHEVNGYDPDDAGTRHYGRAGSVADKRAILPVLRGYYAAAAAGDGARACSLTVPRVGKSVNFVDAATEDYSPLPGSPVLRGRGCVVVMSTLSKEHHGELAAEAESLVLTGLRVHSGEALALLGFSTIGECVIALKHENGVWRVNGLFDIGIR
jgi:hypothetical protein